MPLFWEISGSLLFKEERVCQCCSFVFRVMQKTISRAFRGCSSFSKLAPLISVRPTKLALSRYQSVTFLHALCCPVEAVQQSCMHALTCARMCVCVLE